jgi:hypothetical protein
VGKEGGATDAKPETKKANNYALNPKNRDGYDSKWQKGGATDAKPETKERLNYALNPKNKDGYDSRWQKGARLAHAATRTNCITCKMVPRQGQSDKRSAPTSDSNRWTSRRAGGPYRPLAGQLRQCATG